MSTSSDWPESIPSAGQLQPNRLLCWRVFSDQTSASWFAKFLQSLSHEEQLHAAAFRNPADFRNYVIAHGSLRLILGNVLNHALVFTRNATNKPQLADHPLQFNLSHSGDVILIALSTEAAVGVDTEKMTRLGDRQTLQQDFFHPAEASEINALPGACAEQAFFKCWTRKESVSKALGLGLALPMDAYRVSCDPGTPARLIELPNEDPALWTIFNLEPRPGYAGALAANKPGLTLSCRTLDTACG